MNHAPNESQASVDRVRQEVERWIAVARTAGERALEAVGLTPMGRFAGPMVDLLETPGFIELWVDVPGLPANAVQLTASERQVTIKLQHPPPTDSPGKYHLRERPYGGAERMILLPANINPDQTRADLHDGVLHVTLSKQAAPEPRSVPVNVGG
jgi:HSP20 family molecular chaperone IbpA